MKFQVLIRSDDWLKSAGARIRYLRLQREFAAVGWNLAVDAIGNITEGLVLNADVYLFSKCDHVGALMLAEMLREAGAIVGFDQFDDYVSGQGSLAFEQRDFFRQMTDKIDFLLCSTERMAQVSRSFAPQAPVHVMNDPHGGLDVERLALSIDAKLKRARESRIVNVVWFGQGGNPIFPVGLSDAISFGAELEVLARAGWQVELKVLSNLEALNAAVLGKLQSLPVNVSIQQWSQAGEVQALREALIAFLPVNYQNFSIAKSLNRAVSALTQGAQVLGLGFPLYAPLEPFIYHTTSALVEDLARDNLRLSSKSLNGLAKRLAEVADPVRETRGLIGFLDGLGSPKAVPLEDRPMRGIIHGSASTTMIHRLCTSLGWLSLGSPISRMHQRYHAEIAEFEPHGGVEIRVNKEGFARLGDRWRQSAQTLGRNTGTDYTHRLALPHGTAGNHLASATPTMWATRAARIVAGPKLLSAVLSVYSEIFPDTRFLVSEKEPLLFACGQSMEARP